MLRANDERLQRLLRGQERLVQEAYDILQEEQKKDDVLRAIVLSSHKPTVNHIVRLDPERVFHVQNIRTMCIRYRLRFLDAGRFKGELPSRALYELRRLESRSDAPLGGFKVMAPASRFKLCDSDADPMLFVPVGVDHYYLVHKWGKDLSWHRAVLAWPLRGMMQLALSMSLIAMGAAALLPTWLLTSDTTATWWGAHRFIALLWTMGICTSFTLFSWFTFFGQFSRSAWNSKYFN